jgi:DNA topoisomerase-2
MAQTFVGSNNINLLMPNGQFGTRLQGGKDAGSARYIHTALAPITRHIFIADDDQILTYKEDDGIPVEPSYFLPVLPMILINGSVGIGTGFSTNVPCYNPSDVASRIRSLLQGSSPEDLAPIRPWFKGFKGRILEAGESKWISLGTVTRIAPTKVRISELPIGVWTEDWKSSIEAQMDQSDDIKSMDCGYTDETIDFTLTFSSKDVLDRKENTRHDDYCSELEYDLKLTSTRGLSETNMYMFDEHGKIRRYVSPLDVIIEYFPIRLNAYEKRKKAILDRWREDLKYLEAKVRFIQSLIDGSLIIMNVAKETVVNKLFEQEYPTKGDDTKYGYLLNLPVHSLTMEKKVSLENEAKDLVSQIATLESTSVEKMWLTELDAVESYF